MKWYDPERGELPARSTCLVWIWKRGMKVPRAGAYFDYILGTKKYFKAYSDTEKRYEQLFFNKNGEGYDGIKWCYREQYVYDWHKELPTPPCLWTKDNDNDKVV